MKYGFGALLLVLVGCAISGVVVSSCATTNQQSQNGIPPFGLDLPQCVEALPPHWYPAPNQDYPEYYLVVGEALAVNNLNEGRRLALEDARRKLTARIGSKACPEVRLILDLPISERTEFACRNGRYINFYQLVGVRRSEYFAALRCSEGRVAIGGECEVCPSWWFDSIAQAVSESLQSNGLALAPKVLSSDIVESLLDGTNVSLRRLLKISEDHSAFAAVVFKIVLEHEASEDGAFFVFLRGKMAVVDLATGKLVDKYTTDTVKGGAFSKERAIERAVLEVVEDLNLHVAELRY